MDAKCTPVINMGVMQMWYKFQPAGYPNFLEIAKSLGQTLDSIINLRNSVQQTLPSEIMTVDNCFRSSAREQSPQLFCVVCCFFSTKAAELKCQHVTVKKVCQGGQFKTCRKAIGPELGL